MTSHALDLDGIRAWLGEGLAEYRAGKADKKVIRHVERMLASLDDKAAQLNSSDAVRLLSAVGLSQCVRLGIRFEEGAPERAMLQIGALAMWPVVIAQELPAQWLEALAELTSPRFSIVVAGFRSEQSSGQPMTVNSLAAFIAKRPFMDAVLNLLQDLADPRRGGPVLAAMGMVMRMPVPARSGPKAVLTWVVEGARDVAKDVAEDAFEAGVDAVVNAIWSRVTGADDGDASDAAAGVSSGRGHGHHDDLIRGGGGGHHRTSVADDVIGGLFN